ncbi:MAG: leucyl/phenylalanyl-tRNA--protein transferase [Pseudomonadota bacterium]
MIDNFPPTEAALDEPNGLLAVGGDLSPERLLTAYGRGIFPWFSEGDPILWWSPNPRAVLLPENFKLSRTLRKSLRSKGFELACNYRFEAVMRACAAPRADGAGTWISEEMIAAYSTLHALGYAHSIEVSQDGELVGGLYGIHLGKIFFGESMFSRVTDASKAALAALVWLARRGHFDLIDCQVESPHIMSLGAINIPRAEFEARLAESIPPSPPMQVVADFGDDTLPTAGKKGQIDAQQTILLPVQPVWPSDLPEHATDILEDDTL